MAEHENDDGSLWVYGPGELFAVADFDGLVVVYEVTETGALLALHSFQTACIYRPLDHRGQPPSEAPIRGTHDHD